MWNTHKPSSSGHVPVLSPVSAGSECIGAVAHFMPHKFALWQRLLKGSVTASGRIWMLLPNMANLCFIRICGMQRLVSPASTRRWGGEGGGYGKPWQTFVRRRRSDIYWHNKTFTGKSHVWGGWCLICETHAKKKIKSFNILLSFILKTKKNTY